MQFVANGPDIPDSLLQAHEEGRVVFFCGAGISYPAGLPGFQGLVDQIYRRIGTAPSPVEQKAYERDQFDAALDLLERRLPGQRIAVRQQLAEVLKPKWRRKSATDTHEALLELARCRDGAVRLVTTNFDRIFERVGKRAGKAFNAFAAPMLPIPKNSKWDGLVYLHGLLPNPIEATALQRLVLTSGDFGLAYLTERWAARFVSDLFRNYIVCFVGYSINDPVMRYMMDALAADRMQGEATPDAYAFGDYAAGQEEEKRIEWKAKGVTNPILYEVPSGTHDHSALHNTLKEWAETYRDGTLGKEQIVVEHALARPSASTRQDDFVGRMLWALSDVSGLPAKRFADFNPVPALEWLEEFSDQRYLHRDLNRFGVPPRREVDDKLRFSLVQRPTPYRNAPWMTLVLGGVGSSQWDDVMFHLARWLARHLNDPALIIWIVARGGQLHERWAWLIEHQLDRFAQLVREGRTAELDDIRTQAPNAIPGPLMETLWRLLLTGHVKSPWREPDFYRWKDRLKRDGLTATLRLQLRELLSTKVALKRPFHWRAEEGEEEPTRARQLVDWELVLAADHVHAALGDLADDQWRAILPSLLDDFQQLVRDALDLQRELGEANDQDDRSHWDLPSIAPHWQNRGFRDWVTLIELLRDAWLETYKSAPERARQIALAWFDVPYPTFKRLALFAASQDGAIDSAKWVEWLVSDDSWWLWSGNTKRETMRLLALQGSQTAHGTRGSLEKAILAGPPRRMYREGLEPADWKAIVDDAVWLRLAKLRKGGALLGRDASLRVDSLAMAEPRRRLAESEQDEFSFWMSGTGDPDYESKRRVDIAPRKRSDLVQWLKQPPSDSSFYDENTWRDTCRTRFFHSLFALCDLANEGLWPATRWREALQAWSEEGLVLRSWRYAAPLVGRMPDSAMQAVAHSLTWWMRAASKGALPHETVLFDLSRRLLSVYQDPDAGISKDGKPINEPVTEAINHPIGHVVEALLNLWFKRKPNDNEGLPGDIEPFFTTMCDTGVARFRHGRVLLASRLIALFRVDHLWTEKHLLPLFDWERSSIEAKATWEGFLWSPRLYRPLLIAFKPQFLSTAHHYEELGDHGRQFAALLTYAGLDPAEGYTSKDFRDAIGALPQEGLQEVAQALSQALGGAGAQREDYWKNRVQPFWQQIWPKSRDLVSNGISESLTIMCIAGGEAFPSVLAAVADWLRPTEHPHHAVHQLHESGLCVRFPEASLRLLNAILGDQFWAPRELQDCLEAIAQAKPTLREDHRYQRLAEYIRRRGH
ncbi:SIR2 family protein [Bradyrhizobium sp. 44]|uniref:anti-phage defense-associated sirtuin Dsr1 n=1 Tax=Bradyrhizobium sp. 44 TaxID=2782675 RepID=UPI001FFB594F|nr:anti-phage defense-associated sirtuin Dsr1 [Bradyrhizobium sp. 44]MCK1283623.1 SIR2 family protein [Bradyrhizobium sp. 44]